MGGTNKYETAHVQVYRISIIIIIIIVVVVAAVVVVIAVSIPVFRIVSQIYISIEIRSISVIYMYEKMTA